MRGAHSVTHVRNQIVSRSRPVAEVDGSGGPLLQSIAAVSPRASIGARTSIRKSSVSVPSNVAEGFGRHYTAAYINHLWVANGSDYELQTQLELARRQRLLREDEATILIADADEVARILNGLVKALERPTRT